ncbi:hypothetical protein, conserved [Eimeria praecox]|uniref:Uncharacterized protein n=1 Tax=Eimeria praecox TaxID=51316 RepID=U6H6M2_9EIME|nr:hypothetical protein, conserved [Eimeria praecox]
MHSSSQDKFPRGQLGCSQGSGEGVKGTEGAAEEPKVGHPGSGGGLPTATSKPAEEGEAVSAARKNPHYGEDVDDKIEGTGCSEEYSKLQDCLDDTDNPSCLLLPLVDEITRTGESAKNNFISFSSAASAILSRAPKSLAFDVKPFLQQLPSAATR